MTIPTESAAELLTADDVRGVQFTYRHTGRFNRKRGWYDGSEVDAVLDQVATTLDALTVTTTTVRPVPEVRPAPPLPPISSHAGIADGDGNTVTVSADSHDLADAEARAAGLIADAEAHAAALIADAEAHAADIHANAQHLHDVHAATQRALRDLITDLTAATTTPTPAPDELTLFHLDGTTATQPCTCRTAPHTDIDLNPVPASSSTHR